MSQPALGVQPTDDHQKKLKDALNALYLEAGAPSLRSIATTARCSHTTIRAVLRMDRLPKWRNLERVLGCLGGDLEEFRKLWLAARSGRYVTPEATRASYRSNANRSNDDLRSDLIMEIVSEAASLAQKGSWSDARVSMRRAIIIAGLAEARLCWHIGLLDKAERKLLSLQQDCVSVFGDDNAITLATISDLAAILHERGRLEPAVDLLSQLIWIQSKRPGQDGQMILDCRLRRGRVYRDGRRLNDAFDEFSEVCELAKVEFGREHQLTLEAMYELALTMRGAETHRQKAIALLQRVLEVRARVLGASHVAVPETRYQLAITLDAAGSSEEARKELSSVARLVLDPGHPNETLVRRAQTLLTDWDSLDT